MKKAEETAPGQPWIAIERAWMRLEEDRFDEAIEATERALSTRPYYRPAILVKVHLLQLKERDKEALDLLTEAATKIESAPVLAELARVQTDLFDHPGARRSWERFKEMAPLLPKDGEAFLATRLANTFYFEGNLAAAAEAARRANAPLYTEFADRIDALAGAPPRRVLLPVPFVRQHHVTCAPATLTAISRYFGLAFDHLQVADSICYDGTPSHDGRAWAEQNGFFAREFTVTWDAAVSLLDRGLPFALATVEPTSGHMQAITGYDACRRSLFLRDPYIRPLREVLAAEFLDAYAASGPAGMVIVPAAHAQRLAGLELPDAPLYDVLYRLQQALDRHDRSAAGELVRSLPDHRMKQIAERTLASYDADAIRILRANESLLKLHPGEEIFDLSRIQCLSELGRREERLTLLIARSADPESHPVFRRLLAFELASDARQAARATELLRSVLRRQPGDAAALHTLGTLAWDGGDRSRALALYRLAACLEDKQEGFSASYFVAARQTGAERAALDFLSDRYRRFGRKSGLPAQTLVEALASLDRTEESFRILEEAVRQRLTDGDLLLFAADFCARNGRLEHAARCLAAADGRASTPALLRARASLAERQGMADRALVVWRAVAAAEPLAMDVHREVARLLLETQGRPAAIRHVREASERFPTHFGLLKLLLEITSEDDGRARESILDRLVSMDPDDAWTRRERGFLLARRGRLDDAFAEAQTAFSLEPSSPANWFLWGRLCLLRGATKEAIDAFRQTIQLSVDFVPALSEWVENAPTPDERAQALETMKRELEAQVTLGEGVLAFRDLAQGLLPKDRLLRALTELSVRRPDLWQTGSALARELIAQEDLAAAERVAEQTIQKFPLQPLLRLDLASVHEAQKDATRERAALRKALELSPGLAPARRGLALSFEREGKLDEARAEAEKALVSDPLDASSHGVLAAILWKAGQQALAMEKLKHAVFLEPSYGWGWQMLFEWSQELKKPDLASHLARDLASRRPGDPDAWMVLARMLDAPHQRDERLTAVNRALSLHAALADAWQIKAMTLAEAGRLDEALAACTPPAFEDHPPLELRGRRAWVLAMSDRLDEAIAEMRQILFESPSYIWGWLNLAEWSRATDDADTFLEAAEKLVLLSPHEARSFTFRAEALLKKEKKEEARADLEKALEMEPENAWAAHSLFETRLEAGDGKSAGNALKLLEKHHTGPATLARRIQLASHLKNRAAAEKALLDLLTAKEEDRWAIDTAVSALTKAEMEDEIHRALESALRTPGPCPYTGTLWVQFLAVKSTIDEVEIRLNEMKPKKRLAAEAISAYLELLFENQYFEQMEEVIRRESDWLREDSVTWATVGRLLANMGNNRAVRNWFSDWATRPRIEPWMLMPIVLVLRDANEDHEANRVSQRALKLPQDGSTGLHRLWIALDGLLAGNGKDNGADVALRQVAREKLGDLHARVYDFVEVLSTLNRQLEIAQDQESRDLALKAAENRLRALRGDDKTDPPCLPRLLKASMAAVSRHRGSVFSRVAARLKV
jgi:tetratricopeptide (TPR) repeat protein